MDLEPVFELIRETAAKHAELGRIKPSPYNIVHLAKADGCWELLKAIRGLPSTQKAEADKFAALLPSEITEPTHGPL